MLRYILYSSIDLYIPVLNWHPDFFDHIFKRVEHSQGSGRALEVMVTSSPAFSAAKRGMLDSHELLEALCNLKATSFNMDSTLNAFPPFSCQVRKLKTKKTINIYRSGSEAWWSVQLLPPAPSSSPPISPPPPPFSTPSLCFLVPKCLNQLHFLTLHPQLSHSTYILDCMPSFLLYVLHISSPYLRDNSLTFLGYYPPIFSYEQGIHYK